MSASPKNGAGEPPYRVVAVRYGTLETTRGALLGEDASGKGPDAPMRLDYFFWVIRNRRRTILVDTGFRREDGEARGRTMLRDPEPALDGIRGSSEVEALLLTHLHYDHTGNLEMAEEAPVLVGATEFEYWAQDAVREGPQASLVEPEDLGRLDSLHRAGRVCLLGEEEFIAPGVRVRCVGGHTPGQLIVEIAGAEGPVILASDALHLYEELDGSCLFADTIDAYAARRTNARLRELAESGARVVPGHDPLVTERFPALANGVYRIC
jgi:glyoxylase-like metal-dependent hydrolase (beta-lactamase superfamily II)